MSELGKYTCVKWIPRTAETKYVEITRGKSDICSAQIGRMPDNLQPQNLRLDPRCTVVCTVKMLVKS